MSSQFRTKEFKTLFTEWNKILEDTGHDEIEDFTLPVPTLKSWHDHKFKGSKFIKDSTSERYFELLLEILNTFSFETDLHRRLWELHSEGFSCRQIEEKINKPGFTKTRVHVYIQMMEKKHGLRE